MWNVMMEFVNYFISFSMHARYIIITFREKWHLKRFKVRSQNCEHSTLASYQIIKVSHQYFSLVHRLLGGLITLGTEINRICFMSPLFRAKSKNLDTLAPYVKLINLMANRVNWLCNLKENRMNRKHIWIMCQLMSLRTWRTIQSLIDCPKLCKNLLIFFYKMTTASGCQRVSKNNFRQSISE